MGSLKVTFEVSVHGPLADGTADRALQEWARATAKAIADEGADALRRFPMDKTGRATGGFQENIHVRQRGDDAVIPGPMIKGVTWAPWLEGTSQRNKSTKFAGYHLFRRTRLQMQQWAPEIAQRELEKVMPQLGGD
jgi:hypothetical protein